MLLIFRFERSNYDGSCRELLHTSTKTIHPFSMVYHQGFLFWTDWSERRDANNQTEYHVMQTNITSMESVVFSISHSRPNSIGVYESPDGM